MAACKEAVTAAAPWHHGERRATHRPARLQAWGTAREPSSGTGGGAQAVPTGPARGGADGPVPAPSPRTARGRGRGDGRGRPSLGRGAGPASLGRGSPGGAGRGPQARVGASARLPAPPQLRARRPAESGVPRVCASPRRCQRPPPAVHTGPRRPRDVSHVVFRSAKPHPGPVQRE